LSDALLFWFDQCARKLPWREPASGTRRDPYAVIVSEFMLQQTQVSTVIPYYSRFLERFPDLPALASAEEPEVLKYWEGLGYYRRARQLLKLAKTLVFDFLGELPQDRKTLLKLPGIGEYTAGALLSFVFDLPEPAVDGNVLRVVSRLEAEAYTMGDVKSQAAVRERVSGLIPPERAGDFSEALIELGATICLSSSPLCHGCPLSHVCQAYQKGVVAEYPLRQKRDKSPVSRMSYVLVHDGTHVFCRQRSEALLHGLYEFVLLPEKYKKNDGEKVEEAMRKMSEFSNLPFHELRYVADKRVVFSHRVWELSFWELRIEGDELGFVFQDKGDSNVFAVRRQDLESLAFPAFLAGWRDAFLAEWGL
jgi:A/G-specific adenine glycosylase